MSLSAITQLVAELVQDSDDRLSPESITHAIDSAVIKLSKDKPVLKLADVVADGGETLPLPDSWELGFSNIRFIEYPIGKFPVSMLSEHSYGVVPIPDGDELRLVDSIAAGETVRLTHTMQHVLTADASTLHNTQHDAVAAWAASILFGELAALYSGDSDSSISADSVDHGAKARNYAARSKAMQSRYYNDLGIEPKRNQAAGIVVDFDGMDSRGNDRLLHKARYR